MLHHVPTSFDHDRLDVYKNAIAFLLLADRIVAGLPRGRRYIADQLRRAALSISANIAEGAGEFSPDEKARFYRIARRSATECAALIDACGTLELADRELRREARQLLLSVAAQLTSMVRNRAGSPARQGQGQGQGQGSER
jgi:four helix bundle protein